MVLPSLASMTALVKSVLQSSSEGAVKTRLHLAIRDLPVAALGADNAARIVIANHAAVELTGYSQHELVRLAVPDITGQGDLPHTEVLWDAFLNQGQQRGRYDLRRKDGTVVTVEYAAIVNAAPGIHLSLLRRIDGEGPD